MSSPLNRSKTVAVIGGGPTGLVAAEVLVEASAGRDRGQRACLDPSGPDPRLEHERLVERLSRPRGSRSMASHLENTGIHGVKAGLLREFVPRAGFADPGKLAAAIKTCPSR